MQQSLPMLSLQSERILNILKKTTKNQNLEAVEVLT